MGKLHEEWEAEGNEIQAAIDRVQAEFNRAAARGDRVAATRCEDKLRQLDQALSDHMKKEPPPGT